MGLAFLPEDFREKEKEDNTKQNCFQGLVFVQQTFLPGDGSSRCTALNDRKMKRASVGERKGLESQDGF